MPRIPGTTNAQTLFLRSFRHHPAGPPARAWPSSMVLRRWLARPAFVEALADIRQGLRLRRDFHLAAAASQAAHQLQSLPPDSKRLLDLLRLDYARPGVFLASADHPIFSRDDAEAAPDPPAEILPAEPMT